MPQSILRRIAHRAVQVAILAAGILTILLVFSRQADAATSAPSAASPVSSAASSVSSPAHTAALLGCPAAAAASSSDPESSRQPPDLWRAPGGEIWPPRPDIGAGSTAGYRREIAPARSLSSSHGSGAANRT